MLYNSTRNKNLKITSSNAIIKGISEDGGLFVPENIPVITNDDIKKYVNKSYVQRCQFILSKFLVDYSSEELLDCATKAYDLKSFDTKEIAPVVKVDDTTYMLELWHGPTSAFKDMALQILPHLLTTAVKKNGESKEIIILVATSGDTGKAALEGFKDVNGVKIAVFFPLDGVSPMQKIQMTTQEGNNVYVCAIEGNFDDAQTSVKKIFTNDEVKDLLAKNNKMFSSANSINWGRLAPQIVYYFSAYCDMVKQGEIKVGDKVNITVPTGNFGNILAAFYAKTMGLPVNKLICASNENNVLTDFINTGVYNKDRVFKVTNSPAMDIIISSNLERFLYIVSGGDDKLVASLMKDLWEKGEYKVPEQLHNKIKEIMYAGCCDVDTTEQTINNMLKKNDYLCDTHTAVGANIYNKYKEETKDNTPTIIASTASPFKFADSVLKALGCNVADELGSRDEFELVNILSDKVNLPVPKPLADLNSKKVTFKDVCKKTEIQERVLDVLKLK